MTEQWRDIPEWEGFYQVSDQGRVRRIGRRVLAAPLGRANGYRAVSLRAPGRKQQTRKVHHLVLLAFVGPRPAGLEVRHRDGDKLNNTLPNLLYGTTLENAADRRRHGTQTRGAGHPSTKLTERLVRGIRARHAAGMTFTEIVRKYRLPWNATRDVIVRRTWVHLP